jgi:demethylmenaquinone methyltransferase/2-methoxy-6-polyprenyl-1,4-benzoquinol methylase
VLDCACGTGDLSFAFADAGAAVTGLDFTAGMLEVAREKAAASAREAWKGVVFIQGDAMALPFPDASFDVVSIAFGIRNVSDPAKAFGEFFRVLRPGGRLIVLEFSEPKNGFLKWAYGFYFRHIMPRTAAFIARDTSGAYKYLPKSVQTFLSREGMVAMYAKAGFKAVAQKALTFGIAVAYRGEK